MGGSVGNGTGVAVGVGVGTGLLSVGEWQDRIEARVKNTIAFMF